jgi:hypothetical protein
MPMVLNPATARLDNQLVDLTQRPNGLTIRCYASPVYSIP